MKNEMKWTKGWSLKVFDGPNYDMIMLFTSQW